MECHGFWAVPRTVHGPDHLRKYPHKAQPRVSGPEAGCGAEL